MSTTLLYDDTVFLQHDTGKHVECARRIEQVQQTLFTNLSPLTDAYRKCVWTKADKEDLLRVHTPAYLQQLERLAERGGGRIEQDTILSPQSFDVARYASGAACDAVVKVMEGEARSAFCLIRPPGHHALQDGAMGFCLLNHVAIAAAHARTVAGAERVLIIDWDVHHGNGTQDIFYDDAEIYFLSTHRFPFYPGSGTREETGTGQGLGTVFNLPVEYGTARRQYLTEFEQLLADCAKRCRPELFIISAGFDAHRLDPIGSLDLETEDFAALTSLVLDVADEYCDGRCVSLLEGGYNVQALAESVEQHLTVIADRDGKN